jgi:hypothetical protein
MRWFQAIHAKRSASFLASAARSAECRTELPKMLSRDLVLIAHDPAKSALWEAARV